MKRILPVGLAIEVDRLSGVVLSVDDGGTYRIENAAVEPIGSDVDALTKAAVELKLALRVADRECVISVGAPVGALDRFIDQSNLAVEKKKVGQGAHYHGKKVFRSLYVEGESEILVDMDEDDRAAAWLSLVQPAALGAIVTSLRNAGFRPLAAVHDTLALKLALPFTDALVRYEGSDATIVTLADTVPEARVVSTRELVEGRAVFDPVRRLGTLVAEAISGMRSSAHTIDKVTVVGRRDRRERFESALRKELKSAQISVEEANLSATPAALPPDVVARMSPEIAQAYGTALYVESSGVPDIDLLRADRSQTGAILRETPHLRNGVIAVLGALVLAFGAHEYVHSQLDAAVRRQPEYHQRVADLESEGEYIDGVERRVELLAAILTRVQLMRASTTGQVAQAALMVNALPDWAAVTKVAHDQTGWSVQGYAPDEGRVGEIMRQLRRVRNVVGVKQNSITAKPGRVQFTLDVDVAR